MQASAMASRIIAVDVDDLTALLTPLLADRLSVIVPTGFYVKAADGMLRYSADEERSPGQHGDHRAGGSSTHVRRALGRHGETAEDHIVDAAVRVLDDLRDYIQEAGDDSWPVTGNPPRSHAQIRDSMLYLWYGDHDDTGVKCKPIPLPRVHDGECQGSGLNAPMVKWAESVGTVASPLLAGFSLASVVVVAGDPQKFYWAGAAIISLTVAAITLIAAVQTSKYVHREEPNAEGWYHGTRMLYHNGILALLLGLGFALVPGSPDWPRRVACGLALAAAAGEAIFFSPEASSDARAAISFVLARAWQTAIFLGVVTAIFGLIVIFHPSGSLNVIAVLLGILMIISGIFHLIRMFDSAESHQVWPGIPGLLLIVIGVVLIRNLHLTVALIGLIIGISWIVQGLSALVTGMSGRSGEGRWWIFFGIVSLIAGIVVTAVPVSSATAIAVLVGILFVVMGAAEIIDGFVLMCLIAQDEDGGRPPSRRVGANPSRSAAKSAICTVITPLIPRRPGEG
jgi:uncharacterized membrane protein HdeD (DUF308 family)